MGEIKSLSELAREWDTTLDTVRSLFRRHPELRRLGRFIGTTRVLTVSEAAHVKGVLDARRKPAVASA